MKFHTTPLAGVYIVEPERLPDQRGFFARTWCQQEFAAVGLDQNLSQCSVSFNAVAGTLRGMHYQALPHAEAKLVRCTQGELYDVALDLRPASPTFRQHVGVTLSAENRLALYIPEGCAHGFLTLRDNTEVFYQMSQPYAPSFARGVRWNDSAFAIRWPRSVEMIAERDQMYSDFVEHSLEASTIHL